MTLKTWATRLNFQIFSSPLTLEFFEFIFIGLFLIANRDIKWTSFPVSDKNSQDWFLMNTCFLCAVKPSGHTDTLVHGIQRFEFFPWFQSLCFPCSALLPTQLGSCKSMFWQLLSTYMLTVQLAGLPPFFFILRLYAHFFHPNSQYSLNLYNPHVIWISTYLLNLAEAKQQVWRWFQGEKAGSGWEVHDTPGFVPLVTCLTKWWLNIGHKAQILSLGKSRTLDGSCTNVHPRQGLVWCVLFWAVNREDTKNSWPSDTEGDKECRKLLCAGNSHGYVELVVCAQQVRLGLNAWAQCWYFLVW